MSESGSAAMPVAALLVVLVVAGMMALGAGRLLVASHEAQLAADAAALAAAWATFEGGDPAVAAASLASRNGAILTGCDCRPDRSTVPRSVWVSVAVRVDAGILGERLVRANAGAEFDPLG